ncbi:MAG: hypothetical protein ACRC5M_05260 [Anaeroplasmataceae bacterium]
MKTCFYCGKETSESVSYGVDGFDDNGSIIIPVCKKHSNIAMFKLMHAINTFSEEQILENILDILKIK